ncbi:MAG: flagellar hook-basal body protein [Lachnospiraceae bacterium]|jgi:flagellar basal-body rod protein FlgG|nr:flagellar hook-basal body protein [Lachnospiraceae bacterium]MCR4999600.1 flagellar hook-basal body protein [Lachnospiraceae bacterium]
MMRALWSAASGMISQQANVDTISNNIANVNTVGFKNDKAEFKSLLYQTIQTKTTTANGAAKPIPAQVGLGTRLASTTTNFTQGAMLASESPTAFAIAGDGFFAIRGGDGETYYTRNGDFKWSIGTTGVTLATSDGYPVLDTEGNAIVLPADVPADNVAFTSKTGELGYMRPDGTYVSLNQKIGTWQFNNPAGLDKKSGTRFAVTDASGAPMNEATTEGLIKSDIVNKYLEGSNVQVADEMVNLIVAQRAYEMNSKAIQASDDMLGQANSLRR